jgi:thioredoxin reductase (NADPH)
MPEWDAVIVGGGPAGLTAGLYLGRARRRVLLLEKETPGGYIRNIELIENYPGFAEGIAGAKLASAMLAQAREYGLETAIGEVTGLEAFSDTRYVSCADGQGCTAGVVIFAGGSKNKKLDVPGEAALAGKGVFECAFCDGGHFAGKTVAVCGGGDAGVTEALYLARIAAKVIVLEAMPALTATGVLRDRLAAAENIESRCGQRVVSINGTDRVEGVTLAGPDGEATLPVDGVLVHVGLEPNTGYLDGIVALDESGQIIVDEQLVTDVPNVLAAGDIRSGSPRQVVTAVGDGALAGITAVRLLQRME